MTVSSRKDCLLYLFDQKSGAIVIGLARIGSDNSSFKLIRYSAAKSLIVRKNVCRVVQISLTSNGPCWAAKNCKEKLIKSEINLWSIFLPILIKILTKLSKP